MVLGVHLFACDQDNAERCGQVQTRYSCLVEYGPRTNFEHPHSQWRCCRGSYILVPFVTEPPYLENLLGGQPHESGLQWDHHVGIAWP